MTTPPLDLTAHDLDIIRTVAGGGSPGDVMTLKNTTVLALLDRAEAAEARVAAVRELLVSCASYDVNHSGEVVEAEIVRDALDATP